MHYIQKREKRLVDRCKVSPSMCHLCSFIDNRICTISSNKQSRHYLLEIYENETILILQDMMATTNRNSVLGNN